jgi:hypothetical protein
MNRLRKPGEARARDLDLRDVAAERFAQGGAELLRDRARLLAERRRQQHRGVRRVVAEVRARRALELRGLDAGAVAERGRGVGDRGSQRAYGVGLHHWISSGMARGR